MITTFEIGTLVLPTLSTHVSLDQEYEDLTVSTFRRTADNSGVLRATGDVKLRTLIKGEGWVPALDNLDAGSTHVIKCAMHRAANSATTSVTLPASRRSDTGHQPLAYGVVGDELVATTITNEAAILAGTADVATLSAVSGASAYVVHYWPQITGVILANSGQGRASAAFSWSLEIEEV